MHYKGRILSLCRLYLQEKDLLAGSERSKAGLMDPLSDIKPDFLLKAIHKRKALIIPTPLPVTKLVTVRCLLAVASIRQ